MKKAKIHRALAVILMLIILTTTSVSAIVLQKKNTWLENKLKQGYTPEDAYSLMAIFHLADENYSTAVENKYKKLGSWDAVAEDYGINLVDFHAFIESQLNMAERLTVPDEIYEEMVVEGMSFDECRDFAIMTYNAKIDIETTWAAHKEGKTIDNLIKERTANKTAKSQAATDLAMGKITEAEYIEKMQTLAPEMTDQEIMKFAEDTATDWVTFRTAASGITPEELEMGAQAGFTSSQQILQLCRLKDAEDISTLSFSEMLELVKNGQSVDNVIKDNLSQEKIDALRAENQNQESVTTPPIIEDNTNNNQIKENAPTTPEVITPPTIPSDTSNDKTTESNRFIDLKNHDWAENAVNALADDGIIRGTSANTFSPENNITRADYAVLLVRAFELKSDNVESFTDVCSTDYFAAELAVAKNTGIVGGIGENKFAPRNSITRQDMMVIAYRALNTLGVELKPAEVIIPADNYADFTDVSGYAHEAVSALINSGLVNGKSGNIAPAAFTTRAEVAVFIDRILTYISK